MGEIVYILTNEAMPGLIKIGRTNSDLAGRIRGLSSASGVPVSFELFYACEVADSTFVERQLHDAFDDHRVSKRREFFRIAPQRARAALSLAKLREITLGNEIFETVEDQEAVAEIKRRTRFQFSMIGIMPGTELQLYRDESKTCITLDEKNQVEYKGERTSLSTAAILAFKDMGSEPQALSGPWEWSYQGKRLDELRRAIEEATD